MKLSLSKGSNGTKVRVEINKEKLHFHPLVSPVTNQQLLVILERFVRAIREGRATGPDAVGSRLIVTITSYNATTGEGGTVRLTLDNAYIVIAPTDFLMVLLDFLPPSNKAYGQIMDVLLPHTRGAKGDLSERAAACLRSLAQSGVSTPRT